MKLLLDTHILLWAMHDEDSLSEAARVVFLDLESRLWAMIPVTMGLPRTVAAQSLE